jgi:hypothetical protein
MTDSPDFDWREDESIAVQNQPAIAVYTNACGQVVLRRERSWDEEDDGFIHISKENVLTVIGAILRAAGMDDVYLYRQSLGGLCHDVDLPARPDLGETGSNEEPAKLRDPTAAERQRRRRAKLRDSDRDNVTDDAPDRDAPLLELVG